MGISYPDKTNARGIWKISNITKNIKTEGTWPQGSTRGIFGGGAVSPAYVNTVDYVTLETTGDATDFGDLSQGRNQLSGRGSFTRAVFGGGYFAPAATNIIDYVQIPTTGNATDFGNLTQSISETAGCSNGHGGLG